MTISAERERQLLASVANPADALHAMQEMLTRIRELEKREAMLTELLTKYKELADARGEALGMRRRT